MPLTLTRTNPLANSEEYEFQAADYLFHVYRFPKNAWVMTPGYASGHGDTPEAAAADLADKLEAAAQALRALAQEARP